MSTRIYYFSGTGNSLQIAKDLAAELEGSELRAIRAETSNTEDDKVDCIGIVFPVYAWGPPGIVIGFLKSLHLDENSYIFAIATCESSPGGTLLEVDKILKAKGTRLAAGFSIEQPSNYIIWGGAEPEEKMNSKISRSKERIKCIASQIRKKESHKPETSRYIVNLLGGVVSKLFLKNNWRQAKNFWVNENCIKCQVCVRICPTKNIKIVDDRILWGSKCEQCLACLQWCPSEAIQYGKKTLQRKRYHHPDIKVEEMF